ncbi:MAG: hypothetical protein ACI4C3_01245 [Bacteroides sp.]
MKKMMMTLVALLVMSALYSNVYAQDNERRQPSQKERLSPEQLTEQRANRMANELALDDATAQRFVETYCRYQAERRALNPERAEKREGMKKEEMKKGAKKEEMKKDDAKMCKPGKSEAECKELNEKCLERDQKLLDLRKKYYNEYSKFLTQKQIDRINQMEKKHKKPMGEKRQKPMGEKRQRAMDEKRQRPMEKNNRR